MITYGAHQRGFTLIELMVVIIIISIIAAYAVPSFASMISQNSTKKGASDIVSVFRQARGQAATNAKNVRIIRSNNNRTYTIQFQDSSGATTDIKEFTLEDRLRVDTNMPSDLNVLPTGKLSSDTMTTLLVVFRVCDGQFNGENGYTIWINALGIVNSKSGSVSGLGGNTDVVSNQDCSVVI